MKWHLATNQQLKTIIESDIDCPAHLLSGVVKEALDRGLFNKLIYNIVDGLVKNWRKATRAWNIENKDLLSMGYCGVLLALKKWKPGKASFKSFAFMMIRSEFTHALGAENTQKRYINKVTESYDQEIKEGETLMDYLPSRKNTEKEAIRNIEFANRISLLSPIEKVTVFHFLKGYSFSDLARMKGIPSSASIHRTFYRGLKKMGIDDFKLTARKGA